MRKVELIVFLHAKGAGQHPVVFDLFPRAKSEEQTGARTVGIDPKFKIVDLIEVSGLKAETTQNTRQSTVVLTADGIGENVARWVFVAHPVYPLVGSQVVHTIIELPLGIEAARAKVQLTADFETRFGPVRGLLPESERRQLSCVLE
ncbi:MAG TPA: hypothetical protein VJL59_24580 [Anaerolineales bacterium]|nr:hypothetical protein [Anaerolineales bacterium]